MSYESSSRMKCDRTASVLLVQEAPALGLGRVPREAGKEDLGFVAESIWGKGNRQFPQSEASQPPLRNELKLTLKTYPL